ncbi:hypothetical protein Cni_G06907 [Canna indica]|uniref:Uncharacterized protein n=1 Tax=Canna indica TaxID=4628 RepID=A0AAQ3Q6W1_9LILI|nr:hypothetical protein Cni_G06907 [Canna indica]
MRIPCAAPPSRNYSLREEDADKQQEAAEKATLEADFPTTAAAIGSPIPSSNQQDGLAIHLERVMCLHPRHCSTFVQNKKKKNHLAAFGRGRKREDDGERGRRERLQQLDGAAAGGGVGGEKE